MISPERREELAQMLEYSAEINSDVPLLEEDKRFLASLLRSPVSTLPPRPSKMAIDAAHKVSMHCCELGMSATSLAWGRVTEMLEAAYAIDATPASPPDESLLVPGLTAEDVNAGSREWYATGRRDHDTWNEWMADFLNQRLREKYL